MAEDENIPHRRSAATQNAIPSEPRPASAQEFSISCAVLTLTGVSILIMAAIQLWDHWVDNGEHLLGLVLAGTSIGGALFIDGGQSSMVLFAYALFFALERWWLSSTS